MTRRDKEDDGDVGREGGSEAVSMATPRAAMMLLDPGNNSALVFTLHGFNVTQAGRQPLFAVSLLLYSATVLANLTVVLIVVVQKSLHEPMYVFLCNLCVNGVYGASGFYPKLLHDLLADSQLISYGGCLAQIFTV
ncbi:unnamed protein product [Arctogadus glacialis]